MEHDQQKIADRAPLPFFALLSNIEHNKGDCEGTHNDSIYPAECWKISQYHAKSSQNGPDDFHLNHRMKQVQMKAGRDAERFASIMKGL